MSCMKSSMYASFFIALAVVAYGVYEMVRMSELLRESRTLVAQAVGFTRSGDYPNSILVVGDSTAVGVGSAPELSVAGRLANSLNASVENYAQSGARVVDIKEQSSHAQKDSYSLVVIHAGANDVIHSTSYQNIERDAKDVLERAHALSARVVFLTAGDIGEARLWPRPFAWYMTYRTQKVRAVIKPLVENSGAVYIDLYTLPSPFAADPERYYATDFLHLSSDGYGVWTKFLTDALKKKWPELYAEA